MSILKQIFCNHDYKWKETIHGDEIRYCGWKRTIYECSKCGKEKYLDDYIQKDFDWNNIIYG